MPGRITQTLFQHILLVALTASLLLPFSVAAEPRYVVTVPDNAADPQATQRVWDLVKAAYKNIGIEAERLDVPLVRLYSMVDQGVADAALAGLPMQVETNFPRLVRVPTAVFTTNYHAYGMPGQSTVHSWGDLKGKRVVSIQGYKTVEKALPETDIIWVNTAEQLAELVLYHRADFALGLEYQMESLFLHHPEKRLTQLNSHPLLTFSIYHFLSPEHASLAPQLGDELTRLLKLYRGDIQAKPEE